MRRRSPAPLLALRAFEAAGHLLSFTLAAEAVGVTQGAISRHVKHLEDVTGVRLFERRVRSLALTTAGEALLPPLTRAFDMIDEAMSDLNSQVTPTPAVVGMPPTFATRLGWDAIVRFQGEYPEAQVHVRNVTDTPQERDGDTDIAIEFLPDADVTPAHELLFSERLVLVCSSGLMQRVTEQSLVAALADVPLLHVAQKTDAHADWRMWLEGAGFRAIRYSRGPVLATADMTIQAALKGAGVAVADLMYVAPFLEARLLAQPHPYVHSSGRGYYMSLHRRSRAPDVVDVLWKWLLDGNWKNPENEHRDSTP